MKKQKGESLFRTDLRCLLKMFDLQISNENDYLIQIVKKDKKAVDFLSYQCLKQFNYFVKFHSKWNFSVFLNDKKQLIIELKNIYLIDKLSNEEKEDIGLLMLMEEADKTDTVPEEEIFEILNEKKENNNWTKIESKNDLPTLNIEYHVVINGFLDKAFYKGSDRWIVPGNDFPKTTEIHGITHYQDIVIPKPPIF